jgi:hypothetical protein
MARKGNPTDYNVAVEEVGTFTFGRRRMTDEIAIQVEYARIIDGVTPTDWLALVAGWLAALKVLTVRAPEGWDIDEMDPLDDETYAKLAKVHGALTDKERSFRKGPTAAEQGAGAGAGENGGVLVSPKIQPDGE